MSSRDAVGRYFRLLMFGIMLAPFEIPSTVTRVASADWGVTTITFTIPLATLDDVRRLEQRAVVSEVIHTARYYSNSPIFLAAYVTANDVRAHPVGVADQLVIEIGGYLATQGIEADRISGKGMGIDPAIGRAVVVSFGIVATPSSKPRRQRIRHILSEDRERCRVQRCGPERGSALAAPCGFSARYAFERTGLSLSPQPLPVAYDVSNVDVDVER